MQKLNDVLSILNLKLFDGEGSGDADSGSENAEIIQYGKQDIAGATDDTENESEEKVDSKEETKDRNFDEEFENLIKGDYKKQYDDRVHKNISSKVAQINKLKAQNESYSPLIQELSMKYGITDGNVNSILEAVKNDNSSYEKEAYEKNMSIDELKHLKQIEAENQEYKKMVKEAQDKAQVTKQIETWQKQAYEFSAVNPSFDFKAEIANPEFMDLLQRGVDVRAAYNVVHLNDIVESAKQLSERQVIDRVKSRNNRPSELTNTLSSNVTIKSDPNSLTDDDLENIAKLVGQGKKIVF